MSNYQSGTISEEMRRSEERAKLEGENYDMKQEKKKLEGKIGELEGEKKELEGERDELKQKNYYLEHQKDDLDVIISELDGERKVLEKENNRLEGERDELKQKNYYLNHEKDDLGVINSELEGERKEVENENNRLENERIDQIYGLEEDITSLKKQKYVAIIKLYVANAQISKLNTAFNQQRGEMDTLTTNNEAAARESQKLLDKANTDGTDSIRELADIKMHHAALQVAVLKLKTENKKLSKVKCTVEDDDNDGLTARMSLKFTFTATAQSVGTIGMFGHESNTYTLFNQFSRWSDIVGRRKLDGFLSGEYSVHRDHRDKYPGAGATQEVWFGKVFDAQPKVVVWLTGVQMSRDRFWGVRAVATKVTRVGFTVGVEALGDSFIYAAGVAWVAYSSDNVGVRSGEFQTEEDGGWSHALMKREGTEELNNQLEGVPRIMVAVQEIVVDVGEELKIQVDVTGEQKKVGWNVNIEGTGEGTVFSLNGVWVALDRSVRGS